MFLHLHTPRPPLDRFVELVTYYRDFQPDHSKEKLLPDGAVEIIVDLTETPKRLFHPEDHTKAVHFRHAWISGMRKRWIVIEAAPGSSMAVIRFRPGGAYAFLGFGLEALNDCVEQLDGVLGRSSLRDRILEAPTVARKMTAIEDWLLERSHGRLEISPVVEYVTGQLFAPAGIRIQDVLGQIGCSQRHLRGLFRRWVGLSPKEFGRIRRFQRVLSQAVGRPQDDMQAAALALPAAQEPDWADLAAAHGYYDQSHLIRDFREFSGLTPRQYVSAFRGLENYLPLD